MDGSVEDKPKTKEEEKQELHQKLLKIVSDTESSTPESTWRTTSEEDYKFYAGKQDTDETIAALEAQKRPTSTFNEIKPKIDMLIGMGDQLNEEPILLPKGAEDEPMVELNMSVLKHYRNLLQIQEKELDCFGHGVKSGRSYLYYYIEAPNPFEPQIMCKRIPGRDVMVDPDSMEYDLSDARYVIISKWFEEEEIKAYFPEFDGGVEKIVGNSRPDNYPTFFNENNSKHRLIEIWYKKIEKVYWVINPMTGKPDMFKEDEYKKFKSRMLTKGLRLPNGQMMKPGQLPPVVESHKKCIYYAILSGNDILDYGPTPYRIGREEMDLFPIVQFGAYKDENENRWMSAIEAQKDPQKALNTMRRQLIHLLQTSPKGILVHEPGVILNTEEYDEKSSMPNFRLEVAQGGLQRLQFTNQPQVSPIYQQLDPVFQQSMKDTSGIQDPLMGVHTTSREPGITLQTKQETGLAVLHILYSNLRRSKIQSLKILLFFIKQFVQMPTLIRIEGQQGMQLLQINSQLNPESPGFNDLSFGRYDVLYDVALETKSTRLAIARLLTEFGQNNPGTIPPDLVLEYMNMPFSAKQRVMAFMEQQRAIAEQQAALEASVELAKAQGKNPPVSTGKKKESKK